MQKCNRLVHACIHKCKTDGNRSTRRRNKQTLFQNYALYLTFIQGSCSPLLRTASSIRGNDIITNHHLEDKSCVWYDDAYYFLARPFFRSLMDFFCHKFVYYIVNISCLVYLDVCTFSYHKNWNPFRKELGHKSDVFLNLNYIKKQTIPALFSDICRNSFQ